MSSNQTILEQYYNVICREIEEVLPNVAEQVVNDVKEAQVKYGLSVLDEPAAKALKEQVISIANQDHKIKQLVCELTGMWEEVFWSDPL